MNDDLGLSLVRSFEREAFAMAKEEKLQVLADAFRKSPLSDVFNPLTQSAIRGEMRARFGQQEFPLRQAVGLALGFMRSTYLSPSDRDLLAGVIKGLCVAVFFALIHGGAFSVRFADTGEMFFTEVQ